MNLHEYQGKSLFAAYNLPVSKGKVIFSAEDAIEKFKCGADLVQLYTGFIYKGPSLIKKINNLLLK